MPLRFAILLNHDSPSLLNSHSPVLLSGALGGFDSPSYRPQPPGLLDKRRGLNSHGRDLAPLPGPGHPVPRLPESLLGEPDPAMSPVSRSHLSAHVLHDLHKSSLHAPVPARPEAIHAGSFAGFFQLLMRTAEQGGGSLLELSSPLMGFQPLWFLEETTRDDSSANLLLHVSEGDCDRHVDVVSCRAPDTHFVYPR
eukprot:10835221-Alexandrium_andersonii.AAC.1